MMPRILSVCTLPQSDIQWEEPVIINLDEDDTLPIDEPHTESRNDNFTDFNMEVEEEAMVNVETLDNTVNQDLQEFRRKNLEDNENLKQVFVAALSRGICDDISKFNREQKHLSNEQCSSVDKQVFAGGSVGNVPVVSVNTEDTFPFAKVKAEENYFPFTIVKTEASSLPLTNVKSESNVSDTEDSSNEADTPDTDDSSKTETVLKPHTLTNVKSELNVSDTEDSSDETHTSDTEDSSETEAVLKSHAEFQPSIALNAANIQSVPTVNKEKPSGDHAENHSERIVRNGLLYQKLNNNQTSWLSMGRENLFSQKAPHPVFMVKSVAVTETPLKKVKQSDKSSLKAKVPMRKVQTKAKSMITDSHKRCLVCNSPYFITEYRKLPGLPFCKRCKRASYYQLSRHYAANNSVCHSGAPCRIDYRKQKMCSQCHHKKLLAVLSAAQKLFKEPFLIKVSGRYSCREISNQQKYDWSLIQDEMLLQEALIFQPRVLLKRVDEDTRATNLPGVSKVTEFTKQAPLNLTYPNGQVTSKSLPHVKSEGSIIKKLLEKPIYNPSRVTLETSYKNDSLSYSVLCKRVPEVSNIEGLCVSQLQQQRTTSCINEKDINFIRADNSDASELTVFGSPVGEDFDIFETQQVSTLMNSDSPPKSISKTNRPAVVGSFVKDVLKTNRPSVVGGFVKDVLKQHEAVDTVHDNLVSRYSGRKIRRIDFSSYSCPKAKSRRWATRAPKKNVFEPSKVSVYICGHVCGVCNVTKKCTWLRDHGYSKTPPLSEAKCSEIKEVIKDGTSSKAVLILKKLVELNELLQGSSSMLLELKSRPLQHEFLNTTEPSTSSNSRVAGPSTLQNASDAMVQKSSTSEASSDGVNTSLSNICSVFPNDNLLGQSPQLLQELQINTANTSQPLVCSLPLACQDLLQSIQLLSESIGSQSPQPTVTTTDLAPSFNTLFSHH